MTDTSIGTTTTQYEVRQGAAWITLNRPQKRNALSIRLLAEVYDHLAVANADDRARCIVITGSGSAFCAGADLQSAHRSTERVVPFEAVLSAIVKSSKPVISAVNGSAFGGGLGLIGASDISIAKESATFSFSEVRLGVIPAIISVVCLPKLGVHHSMRLFVNGDRFNGREAVDMGLVHRAVKDDELQASVQEEIDKIFLGGPNAVAECKKLVRRISTLSVDEGLEEAATWSRRLFESEEACEGIAAFRDKRKPVWSQTPAEVK